MLEKYILFIKWTITKNQKNFLRFSFSKILWSKSLNDPACRIWRHCSIFFAFVRFLAGFLTWADETANERSISELEHVIAVSLNETYKLQRNFYLRKKLFFPIEETLGG